MSNENLQMVVTALDKASPVIDGLMSKIKQFQAMAKSISISPVKGMGSLNTGKSIGDDFTKVQNDAMKGLRKRFTIESRMSRQRVNEERTVSAEQSRTARIAESDTMRLFRMRMRATRDVMRMAGVADREAERARARTIAADERQHAASIRRQVQGHRYLFGLRERMDRQERRDTEQAAKSEDRRRAVARRHLGSAVDHGRDAYRGLARAPTVAAVAGIAGTASMARRALTAESGVDAAEINTRIYGGLTKDGARQLRDNWAAPLSEALGASTEKLLSSYTDSLKAGVPVEGAKQFSELATKTSEAWSVPFETVVDSLALANTILTSDGSAFNSDRIKSIANTIQHLAAKQATTPEKLLSFQARGAGAAQVLGMSQEAGLAFGSASTSLGNQAGQSGRMFDYVASRLIEMPRLVKKKGDEGKQANDLVRALGYGSAGEMDRKRRVDPDAFLPDFVERFKKIKDPKKQDQAIRFFTGREWMGEFGRMVKGFDTYKEADNLRKEAKGLDAIGTVWDLHKLNLKFVFQQISAGFNNILGEAGKVLSPIARQFGDYFLDWSAKLRNGGFAGRIKASIEGLVAGFGFKDVPALLEGVFGKPGEGDVGSIETWKATAKAFAEGIRDTGRAISAAFSVFTGGKTDPESIARWSGRISSALIVLLMLAPVAGILGGVASAVMALGFAASGAWRILQSIGSLGGGKMLAGLGLGSIAKVLTGGFWLGLAAEIGNRRGEIATLALNGISALFQAIKEGLVEGFSLKNILGIIKDQAIPAPLQRWLDSKAPTDAQKRGPANALDGAGRGVIQKQSFQGDNPLAGLIQKASFTGYDDWSDAIERLSDNVKTMGARFQLASLSGPGVASGLGTSLGGGGGGAVTTGQSVARGFYKPEGMTVPGWYGNGSGSGGGSGGGRGGAGPGIPDSVPMSPAERNTLGLIMKYEGGGKNQMNYMGKRQGLDPNTAKGYTAQGYFQMLNSNWRRIAPKLGINTTNAMSSGVEDQTRVALYLLRNGGIQNWSNYNPALRAALARGEKAPAGNIPGGGVAGISPNLGGLTPSLDGLRVKSGEATAGGATHPAILAAAQMIQNGNTAGGVNRFTAFNDLYHKGTGSKHASGLAGDFTLKDASKSGSAAEQVRQMFRSAGLAENAFKVIDEYKNPSSRATGGHIHYQINSAKAAAQYAEAVSRRSVAAAQSVAKIATDAAKATAVSEGVAPPASGTTGDMRGTGLRSSGWQPGAGTSNRSAITGVPASAAERAISNVPMPPRRPAGLGGVGGGAGGTVNINQTIHGGQNTPQEIANLSQRQITKDWNHRSHDVEFDMA